MADNTTTQSITPATIPASTVIAADAVTYSGDAGALIAPVSLVTIAGSEGSKTATAISSGNPLSVSVAAVTGSATSATGSAVPANAAMIGGTDGTNLRAIRVDSNGVPAIHIAGDKIQEGTSQLTPKFAKIGSTGSGDTVAAVTSKKIRVLSMFIVVTTAVTVKFQSGASTDLTGAVPFGANGGMSLPFNPCGWFETASGEKLNHVLGSSVAVAGGLSYVEV